MQETEIKRELTFTQNRELSWLRFNSRVLEEADDENVPIIERLRFVSIFTSNLDEFFMVRVGSLHDLAEVRPNIKDNKSGLTPDGQLALIYETVKPLIEKRDEIYKKIMKKLSLHGVEDVSYVDMNESDKKFVDKYFTDSIKPLIIPQIVDPSHPFPHLVSKTLYVTAILKDKKNTHLGFVELPSSLPQIIYLPGESCRYTRTEDIVMSFMDKIFPIYEIGESVIMAVTRNADIAFDEEKFDDDNFDFRSHMTKMIKKRKNLSPVRLEIQGKAPKITALLQKNLNLNDEKTFVSKAPLTLKFAFSLKSKSKQLYYNPYNPRYPSNLLPQISMWEQVNQRDILLFYPYQSMQPYLDLLKESATDPHVMSIRITIYRLAKHSAIVQHLCEAADNGKDVTVLMELRARFDEENNIKWAKELEASGCKIIYGHEGYKCHSKICLITRKEHGLISYITQVGTGNYNESTSKQYTDFSLITADRNIATDAVEFFQNMLIGNLNGTYHKLLVAPYSMKSVIMDYMDEEIKKGADGQIIIKANSVTDRKLMNKLCEASCAGVKVDLIIRGICCLLPGVPEKTENITVTSIVGRYLEHSRIYCFGKGESQKIYISSADIMTRNQNKRVEIACPVESDEIKRFLTHYLTLTLKDNVKGRRMLNDGTFRKVEQLEGEEAINIQEYYMKNRLVFSRTKLPKDFLSSVISENEIVAPIKKFEATAEPVVKVEETPVAPQPTESSPQVNTSKPRKSFWSKVTGIFKK